VRRWGILEGKENKLSFLMKKMNDRFPRLVEFIPIIMVKIVRMFFNFHRFVNDVRRVIW
jgi:hypothetical protein